MPDSNRIPAFREPNASSARLLEGCHILVVEDDCIQCDGIVASLSDAGATIIGPAINLNDAMQLCDKGGIHFAVVDIDLGDGPSFDLAWHLRRLQVPFLFVTAYECREIPPGLEDVTCLEKPFAGYVLVDAAARTAGGISA